MFDWYLKWIAENLTHSLSSVAFLIELANKLQLYFMHGKCSSTVSALVWEMPWCQSGTKAFLTAMMTKTHVCSMDTACEGNELRSISPQPIKSASQRISSYIIVTRSVVITGYWNGSVQKIAIFKLILVTLTELFDWWSCNEIFNKSYRFIYVLHKQNCIPYSWAEIVFTW